MWIDRTEGDRSAARMRTAPDQRQRAIVKGLAPRRAAQRERLAVAALLGGALTWGLIWYPYRVLRDGGIDGIAATTISYAVALLFGLPIFRHSLKRLSPSWSLFGLALAAGVCNLGYVLATLGGEVMRVLLLFYLAPLWTVGLSRLMLGERIRAVGALVVALSLSGAAIMLWHPQLGLPLPQDSADWLGLLAGFSFALFNVLSRRAQHLCIEHKVLAALAGVVAIGVVLLLAGIGGRQVATTPALWLLLVLIGGILLLANRIVQFGLERIAANRAIVIMLSELGFAAVAAWVLAGEEPTARGWLGGALIVSASLCAAWMETGDAPT